MKSKKHTLFGLIALVLLLVFQQSSSVEAALAICTGKTPCSACKNCRYCGHCAKDGKTCGVCKPKK
jgi:hypothetical protein